MSVDVTSPPAVSDQTFRFYLRPVDVVPFEDWLTQLGREMTGCLAARACHEFRPRVALDAWVTRAISALRTPRVCPDLYAQLQLSEDDPSVAFALRWSHTASFLRAVDLVASVFTDARYSATYRRILFFLHDSAGSSRSLHSDIDSFHRGFVRSAPTKTVEPTGTSADR